MRLGLALSPGDGRTRLLVSAGLNEASIDMELRRRVEEASQAHRNVMHQQELDPLPAWAREDWFAPQCDALRYVSEDQSGPMDLSSVPGPAELESMLQGRVRVVECGPARRMAGEVVPL